MQGKQVYCFTQVCTSFSSHEAWGGDTNYTQLLFIKLVAVTHMLLA